MDYLRSTHRPRDVAILRQSVVGFSEYVTIRHMKVLPPVEEKIRSTIRDARALDPLITVNDLTQHLEKTFGRGFSRKYVAKLSDKVARQALMEADRTKLEERMNGIRENFRMMRERLLEIVYWTPPEPVEDEKVADYLRRARPPYNEDVIQAAKVLVTLDLMLFKAELEVGTFKEPVEEIAKKFQYEPLDGEVRVTVIQAWARGGMLPRAVIERMVPALPVHATTHVQPA